MEQPLLPGGSGSPRRLQRQRTPVGNRIRSRLDEILDTYQAEQRRSWRCSCLPSGISFSRFFNSARFFLVLGTSAVVNAAPGVLALAEALAMLIVYFSAMPNALGVHTKISDFSYAFNKSAEDLVLIALLRAIIVALTHHWSSTAFNYGKKYLAFIVTLGLFEIPFAAIKINAISRGGWDARHRAPATALCALQIAFSLAHVVAAEGSIAWARRRQRMGISPTPSSQMLAEEGARQAGAAGEGGSVASERLLLQDSDSMFFSHQCSSSGASIEIHYKLALPAVPAPLPPPPQQASSAAHGIVLIHSFGGGVHSWRQVMQPIADATACQVAAFDRPGFGLTARPPASSHETPSPSTQSPFALEEGAAIAESLARHVGFTRVVVVGCGDGAMAALMAADSVRQGNRLLFGSCSGGVGPEGGAPSSPRQAHARGDSLTGSLDLNWMGSYAANPREMLQRLMSGRFTLGSPQRPTPPSDQFIHRADALESSPERDLEAGQAGVEEEKESLKGGGGETEGSESALFGREVAFSSRRNEEEGGSGRESRASVGEGSQSAVNGGGGELLPSPQLAVAGIALVHPDASGHSGPDYCRVLGKSSVGRRVLRDLLGREIGEVGDPRAWASDAGPPSDVVFLYRSHLQASRAWDAALMEVCMASAGKTQRQLAALVERAAGGRREAAAAEAQPASVQPAAAAVPLLVVHGAEDRDAALVGCRRLVAWAPKGELEVLRGCSRVGYEEQPRDLAAVLGRFSKEAFQ